MIAITLTRERLAVSPPCRTLAEYVAGLIERLQATDPRASFRLRRVVGARRARVTLDAETVEIWFHEGTLMISEEAGDMRVDGEGAADRITTLDLLDGRLEVTAAILEGRILAYGAVEDVSRMFLAIEILLDSAVRGPVLQRLALDYDGDPCRHAPPPRTYETVEARARVDPDSLGDVERAMLRRLGLLS